MSQHPNLLLRDALAAAFVRACQGEEAARASVDAFGRWGEGVAAGPALRALQAEDGGALFEPDETLAPRFRALEEWARDRALRYRHALAWLAAEPRPESVEAARAAWDAGLFFEVHELLEPVWAGASEPVRSGLQGLIMAAAALHHLCEGNRVGAQSLLREAAELLDGRRDALPFDLAGFAAGLAALEREIAAGRVRGPHEIRDLPRFEPEAGGDAGAS